MSYKLLEPIKMRSITLRNRIVLAPLATNFNSVGNWINKRQINYLTRFAKGGVGLVITEGIIVDDKESQMLPNNPALYSDCFLPDLNELVESVKEEGAAIIAQIAHAGSQTRPEFIHGLQPVAPSAVVDLFTGIMAKELDQQKINEIQDAFVACAVRAQKAGFDGVEIHGASGCLLTQFLSPRENLRTDKYGGSIENRARMTLEIHEKIRAKTTPGFIVGYRICADEHVPGGITPEDVIAFVKKLEKIGIDYIHVTIGTHESLMFIIPPIYIPREGVNSLHLSEMIKKAVNVPVMCAGNLNVEIGEQAIREGKIDLAAMARGLIADPELPLKLMGGRVEDIRPCIRGTSGCAGRLGMGHKLSCEVNPGSGKDDVMTVTPAQVPKKVMVIGGGVAGMEAARLAAERGHRVILVEREKELGGHLLEAGAPEFKRDLKHLLKWLKTQLGKEGVELRLHTEATPELVRKEKPDVLIIAVGSDFIIPPALTKYASNFVFPNEVLLGQKHVGDRVVVVGGGLVACETALHVAESFKKKVTIVEMLDDILLELGFADIFRAIVLRDRLQRATVEIKTGLTLKSYSGNKVVCKDKTGKDQEMDADSVVLAEGLQARGDTVTKFEGLAPQVFKIGDCVEARRIYHSFREAWRAVFSF